MTKPRRDLDLTGQRFNRIVVLEPAREPGTGRYVWLCRCDCGTEKQVRTQYLLDGRVQSCGCLRGESHGHTSRGKHHPLYETWAGMKTRCYNPNFKGYKNYGGRGIYVDERWRTSFATFLADMGPRPSPKHTVDRIDVNGPYSPENCRWATRTEQSRNRRIRPDAMNAKNLPYWAKARIQQLEAENARLRAQLSGRLFEDQVAA